MRQEFPILGIEHFNFSEAADIYILNHVLSGRNKISTAHKHDFYLFFLIERGSGIHTIDFVDYPVSNYQIHILLPGQVHSWELDESTKGYQLMFSEKLFQTFVNYLDFSPMLYFNQPIVSLSPKIYQVFNHEFQQLTIELKQEKIHWDIVHLRSKLVVRLVGRQLEQTFEDLNTLKANPIIVHYTKLIDENYKQEKTVAFYADQLNITPNYLNILCKKHVHISAHAIIQNRLFLEAKRLLQISEMTIKEIADDLGFNDLSYFSNFFKAHAGTSPRDFREKL